MFIHPLRTLLAAVVAVSIAAGWGGSAWARSQEIATVQSPFAITVSGVLRDEQERPFSNAAFSLSMRDNPVRTGTTSVRGEYSVNDLTVRAGRYDVSLVVAGYAPGVVRIDVPAGAAGRTFNADVQLRRYATSRGRPPVATADPGGRIPPAPQTPARKDVPSLIWNAWAERQPEGVASPEFRPVDLVHTRDNVLITLDLAAVEYATSARGVASRSAGPEFVDRISKWLTLAQSTIPLRAVVLADPAYFENPFLVEQPIVVDLDRVRRYVPNAALGGDIFGVLRLDAQADFVFGRVSLALKTRGRTGWAPLSIALWSPTRPIEEVPFAVCISSDLSQTAQSACPGERPARSAFGGFDSLRASLGQPPEPDVAVHIIALPGNGEVFGVMAVKGVERKIAWPLEGGVEHLSDSLANPMFRLFADAQTDTAWMRAGRQLRNLLFPADAPGNPGAVLDAALSKATGQPSVYVRMVQAPSRPFIFPIGAIATGTGLLGLKARVELPLPNQAYVSAGACVSQWALVAPPLGYNDVALREARASADAGIGRWLNVTWPFDKMTAFGDWLLTNDPAVVGPAGLFVLSHHENDILRFVRQDSISFGAVARLLPEPSVVVLNACGGARTSAQKFVNAFNQHGATSVVATITEVEADMAGEFTSCWSQEIESLPAGGATVGDVFARARQCLYAIQNNAGNSRFGAKVLKYVLLGDASTKLCPPKHP